MTSSFPETGGVLERGVEKERKREKKKEGERRVKERREGECRVRRDGIKEDDRWAVEIA